MTTRPFAIKPDGAELSQADQKPVEVAMGGMMHVELSRTAIGIRGMARRRIG